MKPGDYVRTKRGIAKYLGLGRDVLKYETNKNTYEHYYSQHLFDNYIFNVGHDYGDTLTNDEFNNIDIFEKVEKSPIDLLEVGDYVNGELVVAIHKNYVCDEIELGTALETACNYTATLNEDIKTIVTKEMFSQMEYKVGE